MTPEAKKEVEAIAKKLNIPVDKFSDRVDWGWTSAYQRLSEDFIREFADRVDWGWISAYQRLSEDFIREFADRVDWGWISAYQRLSEGFIREFSDRVNWDWISAYQRLSEDFIREFSDCVHWYWVSAYQRLSEDFIREFSDCVHWYWVSKYQHLSESFIREFSDRVSEEVQRRKHHTEIDKEAAINEYAAKHNLNYENGVLTAFRNHDNCGRGSFNRTFNYEPGKYYSDWHCDLDSEEENSFGLGIWPKGNTKVLVKVEDWGVAVNKDDGKARVWGFEVVED